MLGFIRTDRFHSELSLRNEINQLDENSQKKRMLYTAHLGDARAVICRGGVAQRLTNQSDHKATCPEERMRVKASLQLQLIT